MSLLHINMVAMTVVCVSLMVGFSYRESRWGILLMQLAVLGLMGGDRLRHPGDFGEHLKTPSPTAHREAETAKAHRG